MREWRRVPVNTICGGCGRVVPAEGPMLHFRIQNVKREAKRCEECDGPAPPGLPAWTVPANTTKKLRPLATTAAQFTRSRLSDADWTARILGERER